MTGRKLRDISAGIQDRETAKKERKKEKKLKGLGTEYVHRNKTRE